MNNKKFENISMKGRMAYLILCIETYLNELFPDKDWHILSQWMWPVTSEYWDEWDDRFIEIIPEYLFEFDSYEDSDFESLSLEDYEYFTGLFADMPEDFNQLLLSLHEMQKVYCYTSIPGKGTESIKIIDEVCSILEKTDLALPDITTVEFSHFTEKDGWGEDFDGTNLSLILN